MRLILTILCQWNIYLRFSEECFVACVKLRLFSPFITTGGILYYRNKSFTIFFFRQHILCPKYLLPISAENITKITFKTFIGHVTDII